MRECCWPQPLCPPNTGPREATSLWPPAWLIYVWVSQREKEEEKKKAKRCVPLRPEQGVGLSPYPAAWGSAAWCFPPLLFQLSGYSAKPKGVFNRGLGITSLTVNSSKVKGLGRCPKPRMLRAPPAQPTPWRFHQAPWGFFCWHVPWFSITACANHKTSTYFTG